MDLDVKSCYNCKIGDMEIREAYEKLCVNGTLKDKFKIVETKGLTHCLKFSTVFKTEWIRLVLSRIHDGSIWLEDGPMKITKIIVHRVTRYPTLDQPKTLRSDSKEVIEKNIGERWNKRGMNIDTIQDPIINFVVRVISHKLYQSKKLNNIPCIAMDVG